MSPVLRRAALPALLLALAAPAAASAQEESGPIAGPYHGGSLRDEGGPVLAYLKVKEDGGFEAALTVRAECEDFSVPVQARVAVPEGELDDEGRATVVRQIEGEAFGPDGRPAREQGEATVTLAVGDDGRARGTVRLASTFYDAQDGTEVASCDTGSVAFRARVVPVGLPRGKARLPRRATELLGIAGVQPLVAKVAKGGDLDGMAFVYRSNCQKRADGRGTRRIVFIPEFKVRDDGSFRVRATQQLLVPGGSEEVRIDIKGRYGPAGTVRGSLRLRGELTRDEEDSEPISCDTGSLRLRAIPTSAVVNFG